MKIELMNEKHLEKIIEIDFMVFEREGPRTVSNLKGLRKGDPEGCFVLLEDDVLVGYSFAKTMGQEGFLGPLGLQPSLHGRGWGKKLIDHSLDYLKSRCKVIGLEVRPDIGNNIGLYHKLGFSSSFPSLILEVPEKFQNHKETSQLNADDKELINRYDLRNYDLRIYSKMSSDEKKLVLNSIELWTQHDLGGLTFKKDLELINDGEGDIIIISQNNEPVGFFAYYPVVFLHLWGAFKPIAYQKDVLKAALRFFRKINPQGEVFIGLNARYHDQLDLLIDEGCKIVKSVNRMLLEGFKGEHLKISPDFVMRVWHA